MTTDIQIAVDALLAKKRPYDLLWRFYDGMAPLVYSSEKLRQIFSGLDARFTENWCAVVVDAVLDRLNLQAVAVPNDDAATVLLNDLWEISGIVDDIKAVHEDLLVTGEAFVIVWPNDAGITEAFQNDARLCHAEYDAENPKRLRFAAKWWTQADGSIRLTLYYADRFEYYVTGQQFKVGEIPTAKAFEPLLDAPDARNEFGVIPVFHFRNSRRNPKSLLQNVLDPQNMVNKLLADMMIAAEFGAFPQRWVISAAGIEGLQNNPFAIWDLVASDAGSQATQTGQFAAAELGNYINAISTLITHIGVITKTPKHFFFAQGGDPSGESLIALEAPLNANCNQIATSLTPTWRDLAAFLLKTNGVDVVSRDVSVIYAPAETVQPKTAAEIVKTYVDAGMPLRTVLRDNGWTQDELDEMSQDMLDDKNTRATYAATVLEAQQTAFDQGVAV